MPKPKDKAASANAAQQLVELCGGLLPVWSRHLATSRSQSEAAVSEMMQAFASIDPHLQMATLQSQQITAALSPGDGTVTGLAQACEHALAPLRSHAQLPPGGAAAIDAVLALVRNAVGSIEQINQPFSHETQAVAAQVERMYIGFQYQDRISQMMALLELDMARLRALLEDKGAEVPALAFWLEQLESQYAMTDQRQSHAQDAGGGGAAGSDQETTFF
jgi:hypothetical protein